LKYTASINVIGEKPAIVLTFNKLPINALPVERIFEPAVIDVIL
jgi:hypothetical protein